MVGDITFTRASYNSPYGKIICEWRKSNGKLVLNVTIPVNTTARVSIPASGNSFIKESGRKISLHDDIKYIGEDKERSIYLIGSGQYRFETESNFN